ncbi:anthrone oxygenase family protein [Streptomyces sp. NBC_01465]|uniref:anthrone oxygenase family protein n=1 Tax=Streptomyces sp. NBC_01465 TaxID=2903878 RepID=UPI002E2F5A98|nr:anthrone oxygenase family protein [Streptomyces sp. NBC_01465]
MTQNTHHTTQQQQQQRKTSTAGLVLGVALVLTGIVSGVWYAYSTSVMLALGDAGDRTFIDVMQRINDRIENPVFFLAFFGALILTGISYWQLRKSAARWWVLAALVLYAAVFLLTSGVNVPLNDELAQAGNPARIADPAAVREKFEGTWVAWNHVRGVLTIAAVGCLGRALFLYGRYGKNTRPAPLQEPAYFSSAAGSSASR